MRRVAQRRAIVCPLIPRRHVRGALVLDLREPIEVVCSYGIERRPMGVAAVDVGSVAVVSRLPAAGSTSAWGARASATSGHPVRPQRR
jgi:hypothetical protein